MTGKCDVLSHFSFVLPSSLPDDVFLSVSFFCLFFSFLFPSLLLFLHGPGSCFELCGTVASKKV